MPKSIIIKSKRKVPHKYQLTKHHRRPRSLGGSNEKENISMIPRIRHDAWHTLFNNMHVSKIAMQMNLWGLFNDTVGLRILNLQVFIKDTISTRKRMYYVGDILSEWDLQNCFIYFPNHLTAEMTDKQEYAWELFRQWYGTDEKIIEKINNTFLDPAYEIVKLRR